MTARRADSCPDLGVPGQDDPVAAILTAGLDDEAIGVERGGEFDFERVRAAVPAKDRGWLGGGLRHDAYAVTRAHNQGNEGILRIFRPAAGSALRNDLDQANDHARNPGFANQAEIGSPSFSQ